MSPPVRHVATACARSLAVRPARFTEPRSLAGRVLLELEHSLLANCAAFDVSPNEKYLVASGENRFVAHFRLPDLANAATPLRITDASPQLYIAHASVASSVLFSQDCKAILSAAGSELCIWQFAHEGIDPKLLAAREAAQASKASANANASSNGATQTKSDT